MDQPTERVIDRFAKNAMEHVSSIPGVDAQAVRTCLFLRQTGREIHECLDLYFSTYGLTRSQFGVLAALYFEPEHEWNPADLAEMVDISRASMTALLDGLDSRKLVVRRHSRTDRRRVLVRISADGREFMNGLFPRHFRSIVKMVEYMTVEERNTLEALLKKLMAGVHELRAQSEAALTGTETDCD